MCLGRVTLSYPPVLLFGIQRKCPLIHRIVLLLMTQPPLPYQGCVAWDAAQRFRIAWVSKRSNESSPLWWLASAALHGTSKETSVCMYVGDVVHKLRIWLLVGISFLLSSESMCKKWLEMGRMSGVPYCKLLNRSSLCCQPALQRNSLSLNLFPFGSMIYSWHVSFFWSFSLPESLSQTSELFLSKNSGANELERFSRPSYCIGNLWNHPYHVAVVQ